MGNDQDHPERIGPYRILDVLGEGGMGTVYKAEQKHPVRRLVAVKVIKLGMDSKEILARFELERRALAAMSHHCIAKVFEAGTTDRGQPYFVMELAEGLPITDYCDKHKLTLKERIDIFREVCSGVQHAHQKGVIHRDLKPGNILVVRECDKAVPRIVDFGLAKATNRELLAQTIYTEKNQVLGTPEYMPPEQAAMDEEIMDSRVDIYSLGVILYELLVGVVPFPAQELRKAGLLEMQRILTEQEPPKPSTKISTIGSRASEFAQRRRVGPHALSRELRGDLDWIVLKAMAKEPERRYDSAAGLAMDLVRHLEHEPVLAGPPSARYRLKKLLRKYRGQLAAMLAVLATALAGAGIAIAFAVKADKKASEFDQLAGVVKLEEAKAAEADLYPAWPDKIAAMERWQREHGAPVLAMKAQLMPTVQDLQVRELPQSEVDKETKIDAREFGDDAQRFLYRTLAKLLADTEAFEENEWAGVAQRLDWARRIDELTRRHPNAQVTWGVARDAIAKADGKVANELYKEPAIDLQPQLGLVPIGMNKKTKLWEFYHLRSAWDPASGIDPADLPIPAHDPETGHIKVTGETGIVFVLLPGGTFTMGAQKEDRDKPNYDPYAESWESARVVTLPPFLLARHETTKGQWKRLSRGEEPSSHAIGDETADVHEKVGYAHPVDFVSWEMSDALMNHYGLMLPTNCQWEYGCRAGTTSPWWTGEEPPTLEDCANVLDRRAEARYPRWGRQEGDFDDGCIFPAPVGSYRANDFGIHDVHGNVAEWTRDWGSDNIPDYRGGGAYWNAICARSALRRGAMPVYRFAYVGMRAAREVTLADS